MNEIKELLTIRDAMNILKISRTTLWRKLKEWNIPVFRDGGMIRIDSDDLQEAIRERKTKREKNFKNF